uniref:Uncharacterized protein n=1 Tax=Orbilia oligospora TaxID=2813651 RepID=A0A6G6A560_ORBOL|nr:hypothetical protein [Orbilia oligospora]
MIYIIFNASSLRILSNNVFNISILKLSFNKISIPRNFSTNIFNKLYCFKNFIQSLLNLFFSFCNLIVFLSSKFSNFFNKLYWKVEKICNENNNIEKRDKDNNVEITRATSLENSKKYY